MQDWVLKLTESFKQNLRSELLNEVTPPGMEKMTGSKKAKASFVRQYGKRGREVMYATAWKLKNKHRMNAGREAY